MLGYRLVILFLICPLNRTSALRFSKLKSRYQSYEIRPIEENNNHVFVNGVLYKTFKKYYCALWNNADGEWNVYFIPGKIIMEIELSGMAEVYVQEWTSTQAVVVVDDDEDLHTLVRGNEGWTFVRQDVNLTLVYPSDGISTFDDDYVITGYQVILFMDGSDSKAYISSGGVLEEHISFTFISNNITTLSYQFWLYGSKRSRLPSREPVNMC